MIWICKPFFFSLRTERDATNWSSEKLKELLVGLQVENDEGNCEITEVSKVEGEASINNRKGKLIFFYEWNLKAKWKGEDKMIIKHLTTGGCFLPCVSVTLHMHILI